MQNVILELMFSVSTYTHTEHSKVPNRKSDNTIVDLPSFLIYLFIFRTSMKS